MAFALSSGLLDAMVLSVVNCEDTYGYKITQEIRSAVDVSESTLYPVLRRLLKDNCLKTYDMPYMGRNRRYYKITDRGKEMLKGYKEDWSSYKVGIDKILIYGG